MSETLLANAMKNLEEARVQIADAHKVLDNAGAPGQFDLALWRRIDALVEAHGERMRELRKSLAERDSI